MISRFNIGGIDQKFISDYHISQLNYEKFNTEKQAVFRNLNGYRESNEKMYFMDIRPKLRKSDNPLNHSFLLKVYKTRNAFPSLNML